MKIQFCSTSVGSGNSLTVLRDKMLKPIKQALLALKTSSRFVACSQRTFLSNRPQGLRQEQRKGLWGHRRRHVTMREVIGPLTSHALLWEHLALVLPSQSLRSHHAQNINNSFHFPNHRITELIRLEKPSKMMKSNHSPNSAKATTTNLCPQVPHPHIC